MSERIRLMRRDQSSLAGRSQEEVRDVSVASENQQIPG